MKFNYYIFSFFIFSCAPSEKAKNTIPYNIEPKPKLMPHAKHRLKKTKTARLKQALMLVIFY